MRKYSHDVVLRLRIPHRPGQLAAIAAAIAEHGALLGDIATQSAGEHDTVRDLTVEGRDEAHIEAVKHAIRGLDGVELMGVTDMVFERHRGGKLASRARAPVTTIADLRYIYTPGVARVSRAIERDPDLAWEFTGIGNSVGIFTNGTRVLGLGDVGPLASMPVMEGKAVLYDQFAGISATPLLVDSKRADVFIDTVALLSKTFGGIHLEDIRVPECFAIEEELVRRLRKPVMHDDQHGTATVALAALINACAMTGVDPRASRVGQIGLGAAGSAIARMALAYGAKEVLVTDPSREAVARMQSMGGTPSDLETILRECHIVVATTGRPGLIAPARVRPGQVIFALSNPDPEIAPDVALAAGAAFAGDGRSINNALAYPGIFKGALSVRAGAITAPMLLAAAEAIAALAPKGDVVPSPFDPRVHAAVRDAVAARATAQGIAGTATL